MSALNSCPFLFTYTHAYQQREGHLIIPAVPPKLPKSGGLLDTENLGPEGVLPISRSLGIIINPNLYFRFVKFIPFPSTVIAGKCSD